MQRSRARIDLPIDREELVVARRRALARDVAGARARHRLGGLEQRAVPADGGGGVDARAEAGRLELATSDDGLARHVGQDLAPQLAARASARREQHLERSPKALLHPFQREALLERDALHERAEHVFLAMV